MLREQFIDTSQGEVFGMSAGNSRSPLVLGIHGMSQRNGWHTWEPLLAPLGNAGFYALSVDMPGWGKSALRNSENLGIEGAIVTATDIIVALGMQPAIVMGKSWGGGVAIELALENPGLVSKLILTAPAYRDVSALHQLTQPVLMAWAEDDPVIPISYATEYETIIPDIELVTYESGGHSAAQNNAEDFLLRMINFLD